MGNDCLYGKTDFATANEHQYDGDAPSDTARQVGIRQSFERLEKRVRRRSEILARACDSCG